MSVRRRAALTICAALALAGGFAAGYLVADDADEVEALSSELDSARAQVGETAAELEAVEDERQELEDQVEELRLDGLEYAAALRDELIPFSRQFTQLGADLEGSAGAEFSSLLVVGDGQLEVTIEGLTRIVPPLEAREAHDRILGAFNDFRAEWVDVLEASREDQPGELLEAAADLEEAGQSFGAELEVAEQELRDAGIDLNGALGGGFLA